MIEHYILYLWCMLMFLYMLVYQIWPPPPYASESCEYASGECPSDSAGPAAKSGSWWWWWWADIIGSEMIGACEIMVLCTGCTTGVITALCPWITLVEYEDIPAGTLDMTDPMCSSKMEIVHTKLFF